MFYVTSASGDLGWSLQVSPLGNLSPGKASATRRLILPNRCFSRLSPYSPNRSDQQGVITTLVAGATGQLGKSVIQQLLKRINADQVAALVRDEAKARELSDQGVQLRVGQYDDVASRDRAMQGVRRVLLIAGTDAEGRS
jgi:NAD(P)H-binding